MKEKIKLFRVGRILVLGLSVLLLSVGCEEEQKKQAARREQPPTEVVKRAEEPVKQPPAVKEEARPQQQEASTPAPKTDQNPSRPRSLGDQAGKPSPTPAPPLDVNLGRWKTLLVSKDREFRSFAAISLLRWGDKPSLDFLVSKLSPTEPDEVRLTVIRALQFDGNDVALERLLDMLSDQNEEIRLAAADALGALRSPRAIKRMSEVLLDNTRPSAIRAAVADALGMTKELDAISPLVDVLAENDPLVRKEAAAALVQITRQKDLGDDPRKWREWWDAHKHLKKEELLYLVLSTVEEQLKNAAATVEKLSDEVAKQVLRDLSNRPDKNDPKPLIEQSKNINRMVRIYVAQELAKIKNEAAFNTLLAMLGDKNAEVRVAVAGALGEIQDPRAAGPLIECLQKDLDPKVREAAASAIAKVPTPDALQPLLNALNDENVGVTSAVASALGELGNASAVEPLINVLSDAKRPARTREAAAAALGTLRDSRALQPLIGVLTDTNDRLRWYAAMSLGNIGNPEAVKPLCEVLAKDPNFQVREAAVTSLGNLRSKEALDALSKAVANEQNEEVAKRALEALFAISGDDVATLMRMGQSLSSQPEKAALAFERVIQNFGEKVEYAQDVWRARELLAQCYSKMGQWQKALPLYEELANHEPERVEFRQELARALIENKEYKRAAALYLEALDRLPDQTALFWADFCKMLEDHFAEIGAVEVNRLIAEARKAHPDLGGSAFRERFERLSEKARPRG